MKIQRWVKVTSTKWRGRGWASPILQPPSSPRRPERAFDQRIVSVSSTGAVPAGRQKTRCCGVAPDEFDDEDGPSPTRHCRRVHKRRRCNTPPPCPPFGYLDLTSSQAASRLPLAASQCVFAGMRSQSSPPNGIPSFARYGTTFSSLRIRPNAISTYSGVISNE